MSQQPSNTTQPPKPESPATRSGLSSKQTWLIIAAILVILGLMGLVLWSSRDRAAPQPIEPALDDQTTRFVVERGSAQQTFQATDNDRQPTTWLWRLIDHNQTCDDSTDFSQAHDYIEGDDVSYDGSHNKLRICFRYSDQNHNHNYGSSPQLITPTEVTVTEGSVSDSFKAIDNDPNPTVWRYLFINDHQTCDGSANFESAKGYSEGDAVSYTAEANNHQRLCFRSTAGGDAHGYGSSEEILIDIYPPEITISQGSDEYTFKATDDESSVSKWDYNYIVAAQVCDADQFPPGHYPNYFSGNDQRLVAQTTTYGQGNSGTLAAAPSHFYLEGQDVNQLEVGGNEIYRVCFRATDDAGNTAYGASPEFHHPALWSLAVYQALVFDDNNHLYSPNYFEKSEVAAIARLTTTLDTGATLVVALYDANSPWWQATASVIEQRLYSSTSIGSNCSYLLTDNQTFVITLSYLADYELDELEISPDLSLIQALKDDLISHNLDGLTASQLQIISPADSCGS